MSQVDLPQDTVVRRVTTTTTTTVTKMVPIVVGGGTNDSVESLSAASKNSRIVFEFDPALATIDKVANQLTVTETELGDSWSGWSKIDDSTIEIRVVGRFETIPDNFLRRFGFMSAIDFTGVLGPVQKIGNGFLAGCVSLTSVRGLSPAFDRVETVGNQFLRGCMSLKNLDLTCMASSVTSMGEECMDNCPAFCPFRQNSSDTNGQSTFNSPAPKGLPTDSPEAQAEVAARREITSLSPSRAETTKERGIAELDGSPTTLSLAEMVKSALILSRVREEEEFRSNEALKATVKAQDAIIHNQQKTVLKQTPSPLNRRRNSPLHQPTPLTFGSEDRSDGRTSSPRRGSEASLASLDRTNNPKPRGGTPLSSLAAVTSYRYTHIAATAEENNRLRGFDRSTPSHRADSRHRSPSRNNSPSRAGSRSGSPLRPKGGATESVAGIDIEPRGRRVATPVSREDSIRWRHFDSGSAQKQRVEDGIEPSTSKNEMVPMTTTADVEAGPGPVQPRSPSSESSASNKMISEPQTGAQQEEPDDSSHVKTLEATRKPFLLRRAGSRRNDELLTEYKEEPKSPQSDRTTEAKAEEIPSTPQHEEKTPEVSATEKPDSSTSRPSILAKLKEKRQSRSQENSETGESPAPPSSVSQITATTTTTTVTTNTTKLVGDSERTPSQSPNPVPPSSSPASGEAAVSDAKAQAAAETKKASVLDRLRARREKEAAAAAEPTPSKEDPAPAAIDEGSSHHQPQKRPSLLAKLKQRREASLATEGPQTEMQERASPAERPPPSESGEETPSRKPSLLEKMRSRRLAAEGIGE